ncbi:MAG: hypothetical protein U1D30_02935 [Planctomycetota bacterium]
MAWYGVNFVLGAGLHAYAFGSGGRGYVLSVAVANIAFVLLAYFRKSARHTPRENIETMVRQPLENEVLNTGARG